MDSIKKTMYDAYVKTVTPLMGTLKESKFFEKGVLTPEEFLIAGENLTHKCPTWEWAPAVEGKVDDKLPPNKQFLVTKKVPCANRIKDVEVAAQGVVEKDIGDGWVETNDNLKAADADDVFDMDDEVHVVPDKAQEDDDEECVDLDDLEEEANNNIFASDKYVVKNDKDEKSGIQINKKVRKYDLSITYDYFHQTPRMWFVGYSNDGRLLTQQELLEDVMAEYANKTVTFEDHPKQNIKQLSIHPCNHAKAMKKMIDTMIENGGKPRVEFSLFVFLKFISSVTPTIEYDNTVDLELD